MTNRNETLEEECNRSSAFVFPTSLSSQTTTVELPEPKLAQKALLIVTGILCNQCLYLSSATDSIVSVVVWSLAICLVPSAVLLAASRQIKRRTFHIIYVSGLVAHVVAVILLLNVTVALNTFQMIILGPLSRQKQIALSSVALNSAILMAMNIWPDNFFEERQVFFHRIFSSNSIH